MSTGSLSFAFGLNHHPVYTGSPTASDFAIMADLGCTWSRANINWATLQPTQPNSTSLADVTASMSTSYLTLMQNVMTDAANHGISVLFVLTGTPQWALAAPLNTASPSNTGAWVSGTSYSLWDTVSYGGAVWVCCRANSATSAPSNNGSWANLNRIGPDDPSTVGVAMAWLAQHFPGQTWELYNEPNGGLFLFNYGAAANDTTHMAQYYTLLAQAAYPQIKAADPTAKLIIGAFSGPGSMNSGVFTFMNTCYTSGISGNYDAISCHPYDRPPVANLSPGYDSGATSAGTPGTSMITIIDKLHQIMIANGDSTIPLWITETGWAADSNLNHPQPPIPNENGFVSITMQARMTARYLVALTQLSYVPVVIFYELHDSTSTSGDRMENFFGVVDLRLNAKPVYFAIQALTRGRVRASRFTEA